MVMPVTRQIREGRRARAEERQAAYDKLSTQEKLDRLPKDGARKQRAKLVAALSASKVKAQETTVAPKEKAKKEVAS